MKRRLNRLHIVAAMSIAASLVCGPSASSQPTSAAPVYRDPTKAVDVRVEDLLSRMTLDEKVAQL